MKDIFDKDFVVNDYSYSDVLEYLENFLNKEYDNEIFKQNIIKLFNNELNILKKDVENRLKIIKSTQENNTAEKMKRALQ